MEKFALEVNIERPNSSKGGWIAIIGVAIILVIRFIVFPNTSYIYIEIIITLLVGILVLIIVTSRVKVAYIRVSQEEINKKVMQTIDSTSFQTSRIYYLNDFATYRLSNNIKKMILIDKENEKFAFVDYKSMELVFMDFREMLNFEIYENGSTNTIGAGVGASGGVLFGARANKMCQDLRLIIRSNNYDTPHIVYDIGSNTLFNMGISKSTKKYQECIISLQEVVSFLEIVKSEHKK